MFEFQSENTRQMTDGLHIAKLNVCMSSHLASSSVMIWCWFATSDTCFFQVFCTTNQELSKADDFNFFLF